MVRLHDAEVELATAQAVDVGHAAAARRRVALDVFRVAVDEAADRLPGNVINAGLTARADGDDLLLRLCHCAQAGSRQSSGKDPFQGFAYHGCTPFWLFSASRPPF